MHQPTGCRSALSLVEVLIVVAIIALLVAILMPSLSGARANARFVACRTNLKNIGVMIATYAQENDEQIPRGPTHYGNPNPLLAPNISTNQVWLGNGFMGGDWRVYFRNPTSPPAPDFLAGPQYVGLGLLTRTAGVVGNEFLFCPARDQQDQHFQGPMIGKDDSNAYSSYLYRQMDLTSFTLFLDGKLDILGGNGGNSCTFLQDPTGDPDDPGNQFTVSVGIDAMALDYNSYAPGALRRTNHRGKQVNIVFRDGSVKGLENHVQIVQEDGSSRRVPWATIRGSAYPGPESIWYELDRIVGTADLAFRSETPWSFSPPPPS